MKERAREKISPVDQEYRLVNRFLFFPDPGNQGGETGVMTANQALLFRKPDEGIGAVPFHVGVQVVRMEYGEREGGRRGQCGNERKEQEKGVEHEAGDNTPLCGWPAFSRRSGRGPRPGPCA